MHPDIKTNFPLDQHKRIWPSWYQPPVFRKCFIDRAARILGASVYEIRTPSRQQYYAFRRFAIAHVMRDKLEYTYAQIAAAIGVDDHSTVINAIKRSRELVEVDPSHASMVEALELMA